MLNKVTKKECMEAIEYLFTMGYTLEMTSDKRHYTEILLKKVANDYNIKLEFNEGGE
jgi:tRNA G46 methylase TrmB